MTRNKLFQRVCVTTLILILVVVISGEVVRAQLPANIPRGDLFVVYSPAGRVLSPSNWNVWVLGRSGYSAGFCLDGLYLTNVTSGEIVPWLAESHEYSDNYTVLRIHVRRGIYWNDGVEFTAEDVAFHIMKQKNTTGLNMHSSLNRYVETAYTEDKYTVVIKLKESNPKFHLLLTGRAGDAPAIMPKHIFENVEDPLTFMFNPPVGTGAYVLEDYDPQGYWCLWKRRDDWERSVLGKLYGKPKPKYILVTSPGPVTKTIMNFQRNEIDLGEVSAESMEPLLNSNPYCRGWIGGYPYAWLRGTSSHDVGFNFMKYPYNVTEVRWALALAINFTEVQIVAFDATARFGTLWGLSCDYVAHIYEPILVPWLMNFTLEDGYKPFDPTIPQRLADYVEKVKGKELTLPPEKIYGPGWWKYDPEKAAELLESQGFFRDENGKWHLPNGDLWKPVLLIPSYHPMGMKIGFAFAEQWKKFGIEIQEEALESGTFTRRQQTGDFDMTVIWPTRAVLPDVWADWQGLHEKYVVPIGEKASSNQIRWANHRFSSLLDELAKLEPEDPKVIDIVAEMFKELVKDMPTITGVMGSRMIVLNTYAWTNYPTAENPYWEVKYFHTQFTSVILPFIERTGRVPSTEFEEEGPSIPEFPTEEIEAITQLISAINNTLIETNLQMKDVTQAISQMTSQITTLQYIAVGEGVLIIVAIILLVSRTRGKTT